MNLHILPELLYSNNPNGQSLNLLGIDVMYVGFIPHQAIATRMTTLHFQVWKCGSKPALPTILGEGVDPTYM